MISDTLERSEKLILIEAPEFYEYLVFDFWGLIIQRRRIEEVVSAIGLAG